MKIKLDDKHFLNSDSFCYWITCEYEIQEGKRAGTIAEKRVSGYVATFEQVVDSFIDRYIKGLEIDDFTALKQEVENLKETVLNWKVNLDGRT